MGSKTWYLSGWIQPSQIHADIDNAATVLGELGELNGEELERLDPAKSMPTERRTWGAQRRRTERPIQAPVALSREVKGVDQEAKRRVLARRNDPRSPSGRFAKCSGRQAANDVNDEDQEEQIAP